MPTCESRFEASLRKLGHASYRIVNKHLRSSVLLSGRVLRSSTVAVIIEPEVLPNRKRLSLLIVDCDCWLQIACKEGYHRWRLFSRARRRWTQQASKR